VDEDSVNGPPCRLALNMKVQGDSIVFDFTGSDPQLVSSMNVPTGGYPHHTLLMVAIYFAFYAIEPTLTVNTGITRPIRAILPEGTVVNPQFPAAVGMRSLTVTRLQDVVFGCLAQAMPERMPAAPSGSISIMNVMTTHPRTGRRVMAAIDPLVGGGGGLPFADGPNGSGGNSSFLKNTPVEINEAEVPIKILKYQLEPDSGGAGLHRGGLSTNLEFTVYSPNTVVTARNRDRTRFRAWGLKGGKAGMPSQFWRNPDARKPVNLGNTDLLSVDPGDVIRIISSGGGGWGDPLDRPADKVLSDVRRGFVTLAAARRDYGVVLKGEVLDEKATAALRTRRKASKSGELFDYGPERNEYERTWNKETYDALTEVLAGLPVTWRHFVKLRIFQAIGNGNRKDDPGTRKAVLAAFAALKKEFPQIGDGS